MNNQYSIKANECSKRVENGGLIYFINNEESKASVIII